MLADPPPEAVLLDAYGTLLALDDPVGALADGLAEGGFPAARDAVAEAFAAEVAHYRAHQDEGRDGPSLLALRRDCAAVLADALQPPRPPRDLVADLLATRLRYVLFPDVRPALDALLARGVRLAVVSNWDAGLPGVLDGLGIADRFAMIAPSATAGARKPNPAHFAFALRAMGVAASAALHVGDDPDLDCTGATRAGIRAVLVDRDGRAGGGPWPRVSSLEALVGGPPGA